MEKRFKLVGSQCSRCVFCSLKHCFFPRLILIKVLRPDCLLPSVRSFVHDQMGESFVQSGGFDLGEVYSQSQSNTPLIFILSPGQCT